MHGVARPPCSGEAGNQRELLGTAVMADEEPERILGIAKNGERGMHRGLSQDIIRGNVTCDSS